MDHFLVIWWSAALWTNRATSRAAIRLQVIYFIGFGLGFTMLFDPGPATERHALLGPSALLPPRWQGPLWQAHIEPSSLLLALKIASFAFAWWARIHLGRLWSGMLTLREGHRVVDTGPYALVRHPIYTGFIAASWALALMAGRPTSLLGAVILTIVMTLKAGTEERLLAHELGPASYESYRQRVPMLIPWVNRSR